MRTLIRRLVDFIILGITIMLFVDFLVNGNNHTGYLWIFIAYITATLLRLREKDRALDKYVTIYNYRVKLGLHDADTPSKTIFSWVVTIIMALAGLAILIDFFFR